MMRILLLTATAAATMLTGAAVAQTAAPATTTAPAAQPMAPATGAAATTAPATGAAAAPAAAGPKVGDTVYGPEGNVVGRVEAVDGGFVTLATAKNRARLPVASFGTGPKGPTTTVTAEQVDAAAGQTAAAAGPVKLTTGATVKDGSGGQVGTIGEVSTDYAVVDTGTNKVRLPLNAFADNGSGPVIGMTQAELNAAANAAKPKS